VWENQRSRLLSLAEQLFAPQITVRLCQEIGLQMCELLNGDDPGCTAWLPPPEPALVNSGIPC